MSAIAKWIDRLWNTFLLLAIIWFIEYRLLFKWNLPFTEGKPLFDLIAANLAPAIIAVGVTDIRVYKISAGAICFALPFFYLLPIIIAGLKGARHYLWIVLFNTVGAGMLGIGWFVALVWAITDETKENA